MRWDDRKCPPNDHGAGIERVYARDDDDVCDDVSVHRWVITIRVHCNYLEQNSGDQRGYDVLRISSEACPLQEDAIDAVENNCCDRHFGDRYCDAIDVLDTERVLVMSRARNAYPLLLLDQLPQTEKYVFDHNLT